MRRALPALVLLLAALSGPAGAAEARQNKTGAASPAAAIAQPLLDKINQGLKTLPPQSGRFEQFLPNGGRASGSYHMDWPQRLRFAYDGHGNATGDAGGEAGNVATGSVVTVRGKFVAVQDGPGREPNWFPVSLTPLAVLRQAAAAGIRRDMISAFEAHDSFIAVTLFDPSGALPGQATLYFARPDLTLYAWRLVDVQNLVTQIRLRDRRLHDRLADDIFAVAYDEDAFEDE